MGVQGVLALDHEPEWPPGFVYRRDFVGQDEEHALVDAIAAIEFSEVRMRGQVARRRTAHFGWLYAYEGRQLEPGPPVPAFLLPLRERAAALAGVAADELSEALVTEYVPGAGIGWHRDAPMFGRVVGVSLGGACRFRLRRGAAKARELRDLTLEPRSAYLLSGSVRWACQHSIPPTKTLRYSVTFRTLRSR